MALSDFGRELATMQATLHAIEMLFPGGRVPPEGLEDFESAVDDIRPRVWAIMAAAGSGAGGATPERFRVRRAVEICNDLAEDLASGRISPDHPGVPSLREAAERLAEAVERSARPAA